MKDYLGYITVRFLSFIFCILPLQFGLFIGRCIGAVIFFINKKRRVIAYANLKAAFCKEKKPGEIKKIVKGVYRNLGQVFIEILRFPVTDKRYIERFVDFKGLERIEEGVSRGKGTVLLTAHFGNWELSSLAGGLAGLPLSVLAREQKHTRLNDLLNSYRQMAGCKIIKKGFSTRQLVKALRSKEVVGILTDQDAGKLGVFVDFFGRPTSTHSGAFVFAQKTGARILPTFIVRQEGPYHKVDILKPIEFKNGQDSKPDIASAIQEFSHVLESYVRKHPEQWLWVHKRWKSTPYRSILILNDGKAGHLNQSIAVANIIQKHREDRGCRIENTPYNVIDVKYKNNFLRGLFTLCSKFSSSGCQGCMRCAKFCLEKKSYQKLIGTYADIVISCGASLEPLNVLMARENNAKNVIIMKPNLVSSKNFNLAIIPRHDRPRARKNILVTTGSPNRISEELVQEEAQKFSSRLDLKAPFKLGLFLGGNNPDYEMGADLIKNIISQIKAASERFDLEILATTSRRTPKEVASILKEELAKFPRCKLLVVANEKNVDGAVPAILGLSKVVLVSGESISMISEAASSGKYTMVFPLDNKSAQQTRHDKLVRELDKTGFIKLVDPGRIEEGIEKALNPKNHLKRLNDYEKIYNAVGRLL